MLRLVLDGNEMDLYENESVNLTLQFSDVQEINATTGSFSQTFRLPATANNLDFFGTIDNPSSVDAINTKIQIEAELYSDSVPIIRGFCQVKNIYQQKERYADIEVVFFGVPNLRAPLAGKLISDLDLSAYDHVLNYSNVTGSWVGVGIGPEIRYGLIDKGFNWSVPDNEPWTSTSALEQGELTPFVQAKVIFDAILDEAGYTYDSDFFDTTGAGNFSEIYIPAFNGSQTPVGPGSEFPTVRVALDADYTGTSLAILSLSDLATNAVDDNDDWVEVNNRFVAPYTGWFTLDITYSYQQGSLGSGSPANIFIYKNASAFYQLDTNTTIAYNRTFSIVVFLLSGDYIDLRGQCYGSGATIFGNDIVGNGVRTQLDVTSAPAIAGQTVGIAQNLPEMKQIDFILGLQKMFNLVFVPDKNKPNHILVEPFKDYTATGTAKDWTDRVDYDMDVTIKPTTDLQSARYDWSFQRGTDFVSDMIQKSLDRVYGSYRVLDPENDFATGTKTIETTFAQYMTSLIPGSGFPIHRSLNADGSVIEKPLPMLAYWHGLSDNFGPWYLYDDSRVAQNLTGGFPSFSNYSSDFASVDDDDLNYGMETPFFSIEANPANTLYFKFWAQYVAELYSQEARILSCSMRLSRVDLADFEFSDRIFIKDSYYRVRRISYDANIEGVCSVELIKELSDIEVCEDTPTGYSNRYNYVLFNNSTEITPDYGSKSCCELYGYKWLKNTTSHGSVTPTNLCRPRLQTTQPQ